jgi:hypothetical protein
MRRNRNITTHLSPLVNGERAVTASLAGRPSVSGADPTPGKEGDMRRITHISRSLVVAAVFVSTAVLAAAFPLLALADNGGGPGPH